MEPDELVIAIVSGVILFAWMIGQIFTPKHRIYFRHSAGAGMVRLGVVAALGAVVYVLLHHADPSVVGIYRWFYLLFGLAAIVTFGIGGAGRTGVRHQVDVLERGNPAAGLLVTSFVVATGLIFAGSLVGEANPDPTSDDEGGWWIPFGFFLAGWISLSIATLLYRVRDTGGGTRRIRQRRDPREALAFSLYIFSSGWILAGAVAGDFYGWIHGLIAVGAIATMLIAHEVLGLFFLRDQVRKPKAMSWLEVIFYLGWSVGYTLLSPYLPEWGRAL